MNEYALRSFDYVEHTLTDARVTPVRVLNRDGAPWFVIRDVYNAIGIRGTNLTHVNELDRADHDLHTLQTVGGRQAMRIVSEKGLVSVVERMRKNATREFRVWMYSTLIPQGRAFVMANTSLAQPEAAAVAPWSSLPVPVEPVPVVPAEPAPAPVELVPVTPAPVELVPEPTMPEMVTPVASQETGAELFTWEGGAQVRVVTVAGEPWFVAKDVCEALGLINVSDACGKLDDDVRTTIGLTDGKSGSRNTLVVRETGLYMLIGQSRKPEARAFQRWVYGTVLPSIRKTGGYGTGMTESDFFADPDRVARIAVAWAASEREAKRLAAQAQQLTEENHALALASEKKDNMIASRDQVIEATCSALSKVQPFGRVTCRQYDHRF